MDIPLPGEILPQTRQPAKHAVFSPHVSLIPPPPLPSVPLFDDIPMPDEGASSADPPVEDTNRYSPSGAMFEDDNVASQGPKTSSQQSNRFSVLGRIKAKKRLLAFSATKQAGGAGLTFNLPKKVIMRPKTAKEFIPSVGVSEEEKSSEVLAKKKAAAVKKGATREDKARAVITAIEEIKREELLMRGAFRLAVESKSPGKMTAPIPLQGLPVDLTQLRAEDSKRKLASDDHSDSHLVNTDRDSRRKEGKKEERRSHRKSERRSKDRQRDRKEKSKPKKELFKLPLNWLEVRSSGMKLEDIRRKKLELESIQYNSKIKSGGRNRLKEDKQRDPVEIEKELCNPFDYPAQVRMPLRVSGVRQREKEFSWTLVQYTSSKPTVTYCVNPTCPSAGLKTRAQILAHAKPEAVRLMNLFLERNEVNHQSPQHDDDEAQETGKEKCRKWYPKVDWSIFKTKEEGQNRLIVPLPGNVLKTEASDTGDMASLVDVTGEISTDYNDKSLSQGSLVIPLSADQIRVPSKWDSDYEEDTTSNQLKEADDKESLQSPLDDDRAMLKDQESVDSLPVDLDVNGTQEKEQEGETVNDVELEEESNNMDVVTLPPGLPGNSDLKLVSEYEEFMKAVADEPSDKELQENPNLIIDDPHPIDQSPVVRKMSIEENTSPSHELLVVTPTKKKECDKVNESEDTAIKIMQMDTDVMTEPSPDKISSETSPESVKTKKKRKKKKNRGKKSRKFVRSKKKQKKKRKKKKARHSSSSSSSDDLTEVEEKEVHLSKLAKKKKKKKRKKKKKDSSSSSSDDMTDAEEKEDPRFTKKKKKKNVSSSSSEEITDVEEMAVELPKQTKRQKKKHKKDLTTTSSSEDWSDVEKEVEPPKQPKKKKKKKVHLKKKKSRKKAKRVETSSSEESSSSDSSSDSSRDESSSSDDHRRSSRKRKKPSKKRRRKESEERKQNIKVEDNVDTESLNTEGVSDSSPPYELVESQIEAEDHSSGESCWEDRSGVNKACPDTKSEGVKSTNVVPKVTIKPKVAFDKSDKLKGGKEPVSPLKLGYNSVPSSLENSPNSKPLMNAVGQRKVSDKECKTQENQHSGTRGFKETTVVEQKHIALKEVNREEIALRTVPPKEPEITLMKSSVVEWERDNEQQEDITCNAVSGSSKIGSSEVPCVSVSISPILPLPIPRRKLVRNSSSDDWEKDNDKWLDIQQDKLDFDQSGASKIVNVEEPPIAKFAPPSLPRAKRRTKSSFSENWEKLGDTWMDLQLEKLHHNFPQLPLSANQRQNYFDTLDKKLLHKQVEGKASTLAESKPIICKYTDLPEMVSKASHTLEESGPNKLPIPNDLDVLGLSAVASNGMVTSFFEDVTKDQVPLEKIPETCEKRLDGRSLIGDLYSPGQEDDKSTTSEEMAHNKLDSELSKSSTKQCTIVEPIVGCQIPTIVSAGTKVSTRSEPLLLLDNIPLPPSHCNLENLLSPEKNLPSRELLKTILQPKKLLGKMGKDLGETTKPHLIASEQIPSLNLGKPSRHHLITVKLLPPTLALQVSKDAKGHEFPPVSIGAKLNETLAPCTTKDQISHVAQSETGMPIERIPVDMFGDAKSPIDIGTKPRVRKRFSRWSQPTETSPSAPNAGGWIEVNKPSVEAPCVGGWTQIRDPLVESTDVGGWIQPNEQLAETASVGSWTEPNNPSVDAGVWTHSVDPSNEPTGVGWSRLDPSLASGDMPSTNNKIAGDHAHSDFQTSRSDIPFAKDIFPTEPSNDLESCGNGLKETLPTFQATEQEFLPGEKCHIKIEEDSKSDYGSFDPKKRENRTRDDSRPRDDSRGRDDSRARDDSRIRDDSRGRGDSRSRENDGRGSRDRGRSDRDSRRDRERDRWDGRRKDDRRRNSSREEGGRGLYRDKRPRSPTREDKSRSPDKYRSVFKEERPRTPIRDERRRSSERSIRRLSGDRRKSPIRESRSPNQEERRRSVDRPDRRRSPRKDEKRWKSLDSSQEDRRHPDGDRRVLREISPSDNSHLGTIPLPVGQVGLKPHSDELVLHPPSLPDSTVIDSELVPASSVHHTTTVSGKHMDKKRHVTALASPPSPKRLSLDERLALELGVEMTPPLPVPHPQIPSEIYPRYDSFPPGFQPYSTPDGMCSATKPGLLPTPSPDKYLGPPVINQFGIPVLQDNQVVPRPNSYANQVQPPQNFQQISYTTDITTFENTFVPPENFSRPPPVVGNFVPENYPVQSEHLQNLVSLQSGFASRLSSIGASTGSGQQALIELDTQSIGTPPAVYPAVYPVPYTPQAPTLPDTPRLKQPIARALSPIVMSRHEREKFERRQKKKDVQRREKEQERWSEIKNNAKYKAALQQEGEVLRRNSGLNLEEIRLVTTDTAIKSVTISTVPRSGSDKVVPLPQAGRGILISAGFRDEPVEIGVKKAPKTVRFADDVLPGEGTSPSAGEELPSSPPYDPGARKKEKKLHKKKQKIKVQVIRKTATEVGEKKVRTPSLLLPPPPPPDHEPPAALRLLVWQAPPEGYMWKKISQRVKRIKEPAIVPAVPEPNIVNQPLDEASLPPAEMPTDLSSPVASLPPQFTEPPNQLAALIPTIGVQAPRRNNHSLIHVLGHKRVKEQLKALVPRQTTPFVSPLDYRVKETNPNMASPSPSYSQCNIPPLQTHQMIALPLKFPLSLIKPITDINLLVNQAPSNVVDQSNESAGSRIPVVSNAFFEPAVSTPPPRFYANPPPQHHGIPVIGGGPRPPPPSSPYQSPSRPFLSSSPPIAANHCLGLSLPNRRRVAFDTTQMLKDVFGFVPGNCRPFGSNISLGEESTSPFESPRRLEGNSMPTIRQSVMLSFGTGEENHGMQFAQPPEEGIPLSLPGRIIPFPCPPFSGGELPFGSRPLEGHGTYGHPYMTVDEVPLPVYPMENPRPASPPPIFNAAQNVEHRMRVPRNRPKHRQYRQ